MKALAIVSVKGGTGKSTVCAHLGLSLRDKGFKVGFLDIDLTGPNLPTALGMPEPFPHVGLDTVREKMLAVKERGYEIFSLAFRFGKAALMWKGGEQKIKAFGREFDLRGTGRYQLVRQMIENVEFSERDYLLVDCPPTTGDEVLSLLEHLDIYGIVLVCQPTSLSVQDMERALNMVEVKRLPLIGLVGNMVEVVCPRCGHIYNPYLDTAVDLEGFCRERGIPYLAGIPFIRDTKLAVYRLKFDQLAEEVASSVPLKIWERTFSQKLDEAVLKGVVKGLFGKE